MAWLDLASGGWQEGLANPNMVLEEGAGAG